MIESCITKATPLFEVQCNKQIEFSGYEHKQNELEKLSSIISSETGVPEWLIYLGPNFSYIDHWHKINSKWYFYKGFDTCIPFINELLGEIISEYFDLKTVHYNVAKLFIEDYHYEYGVISENFCKTDRKYKESREFDLGVSKELGLGVLKKFEKFCVNNNNYFVLISDLKKFFIRDFYTSQMDRTTINFLFEDSAGEIRLAPLYDYENGFEGMFKEIYRNAICYIDITDSATKKILQRDDDFQQLFYKLMRADISQMLCEVEDRHKIFISQKDKDYYIINEAKIKELVLVNGLAK